MIQPPIFNDEDGPFLVYDKAKVILTGRPDLIDGESPRVVDAREATTCERQWADEREIEYAAAWKERTEREDAMEREKRQAADFMEALLSAVAKKYGVDATAVQATLKPMERI